MRWQPCRICGGEVHNKANNGLLQMVAPANSEPTYLDQAGQDRGWADYQLSRNCCEMNTVVTDKNGRRKLSGAPAQDELEREPRLSRAGWPTDQDRTISNLHRGRMHACVGMVGHGAGSLTTKRAPAIVGSPSSPTGPRRFSAQMRPPWASMICLEIDSPRPEFWPNPWCGRSV